jgi:hypothetical protein
MHAYALAFALATLDTEQLELYHLRYHFPQAIIRPQGPSRLYAYINLYENCYGTIFSKSPRLKGMALERERQLHPKEELRAQIESAYKQDTAKTYWWQLGKTLRNRSIYAFDERVRTAMWEALGKPRPPQYGPPVSRDIGLLKILNP